MLKKVLFLLLLSVLFRTSYCQDPRARWVDSVFSTLSREAKVAQLFMLPLSTYSSQAEIDKVSALVKSQGIGGLIVTRGGPLSHAHLLNQLQKVSRIQLLAGLSAEWGLAQTLDSTMGFQKPMVASAWKEDSLVMLWGKEIAQQMKMLGFQINFAPNADTKIFTADYLRYFSNQNSRVASRAVTFTRALQSQGIFAVTKCLPKKLNAENSFNDSTLILTLDQIDTTGFYPLQQLIRQGVDGLATSYLHFSTQDKKGILPPLSTVFVAEMLKKKMGFRGLVFTEVKDFQKTTGRIRAGEAERLAFETGNDVLMNPVNVTAGIKKISRRVKKDKLLQAQLDESVKKILAAKFDAGLTHFRPVDTDNLFRRLHAPESYLVKYLLAEASVTVVKNTDSVLPIQRLEGQSFVCLSIGKEAENDFTRYLKKYAPFKTWSVRNIQDTTSVRLQQEDIVVLAIFPYAMKLEKQLASWTRRMSSRQKTIVIHFGNPSSLGFYEGASALIAAYTDQDLMTSVAPQMIFGALPARGVLPLTISDANHEGSGVQTTVLGRMSYSIPEAEGMNSEVLDKISEIASEAIDSKATPGCQVVIVRKGKVVYEKSFGTYTYDQQVPVTDETIYDLASLTKVLGTVQIMMFLHEKGLIDLDKKASVYLPELRNTNKKDITLKDILTHQSGLVPFIPLWPQTVDEKNEFLPVFYSRNRSEQYPLQVAPDLFASALLRDSLWSWTLQSKLLDKPARTPFSFRYSDIGPWILYMLSEKLLNQPIDEFLHENLYEPMGAWTTGYLPLSRFDVSLIAPTEKDTVFRKGMIAGTVHDERAAMLGGVAGHAGLFSNATDVAKLGQMLLQKGYYGGHQYFKPETVELFTKKQFETSRRGLGWDKPVQSDWSSPTSPSASPDTFGHTGFTGTCIWIDPEFDVVYVFLSNRVHPDRSSKFLSLNIRTRIQEVIYQSMFRYCANKN